MIQSMGIGVTLTKWELAVGRFVGRTRQSESRDSEHTNDMTGQLTVTNIEAARAECAVAKWLGVYWDFSINVGKRPDILQGDIQVRHTCYPNGRLMVRRRDNPDERFVLVTGFDGEYVIHGWMYGHEAKEDKYWDDSLPYPCWAVPQSDLRPLEELKRCLSG